MLYFIPSWYNDSYFREKEQYWFIRRLETEFDDSVKQIQLFNRNKISDFKILLLSYVRISVIFYIDRVFFMHLIGLVLMPFKK